MVLKDTNLLYMPFQYTCDIIDHMQLDVFPLAFCQKLVYYKHRICQPRETNECSIIQIGQNNLQCKRI